MRHSVAFSQKKYYVAFPEKEVMHCVALSQSNDAIFNIPRKWGMK